MLDWWTQRAPREQALLLFAAGVAAVALLIQGILIPSVGNRGIAAQSVAHAEITLVRLSRLEAEGVVFSGSPVPNAAQVASEYAAEAGLVRRAAAEEQNDLRFAFDPAAPTIVFSWIDRVETSLGLTVRSAKMTSSGNGRVEAVIEFSGDQTP